MANKNMRHNISCAAIDSGLIKPEQIAKEEGFPKPTNEISRAIQESQIRAKVAAAEMEGKRGSAEKFFV